MNMITQNIDYPVGDANHQGYLAYDESISDPVPGVVIVQEWWGLNDYMIHRAHMLAEMGYVALALDMYGDGQIAEGRDQATDLMNGVLGNMQQGSAALRAGYQVLLDRPGVDCTRTAAIGYCFGGAMVLHMARIGLPLRAAVSFHGALGSFHSAPPGSIQARMLVCHGEADSMVTMNDLAKFEDEMKQSQADYEVLLLPQAKHGFSNPQADINAKKFDIDVGYQEKADQESWAAMQKLFGEVMK